MTNEFSLPFYELFVRLRQAGFPLGISDYNLLIEALETDIYPLEPKSLKQLLQTIWVKTSDRKQQFDAIFNDVFSQNLVLTEKPLKPSDRQTPPPPLEQQQTTPTPSSSFRQLAENYFFFPAISSAATSVSVEKNIEVVKAVRTARQQDWVAFEPTGKQHEYLPVTAKQMVQGWYSLKSSIRTGTRLELDINATIEQTKRQGKLVTPVLKPRRFKYSSLLLLIDQKGSMQPFHVLSRQLVATARQTECLESQFCYYFNNYPQTELYCEPQFNTEIPLEQVLARLSPQRAVVLIFSDAGAARRDYIARRIRETEQFLKRLKQQVKAIAWLNPLPESSWQETTAAEIAKLKMAKMFPADRAGFQKAIEVLQ